MTDCIVKNGSRQNYTRDKVKTLEKEGNVLYRLMSQLFQTQLAPGCLVNSLNMHTLIF